MIAAIALLLTLCFTFAVLSWSLRVSRALTDLRRRVWILEQQRVIRSILTAMAHDTASRN